MSDEKVARLRALLKKGGWQPVQQEATTLLLKQAPGYTMPPEEADDRVAKLFDAWMAAQGYYGLYVERGSLAYEAADLARARREYLQAVENGCPDPYAYGQLCGIALQRDDWIEAATFGREAVRLQPWDSFSWCRLGQAYTEQGDAANALDCFRRALRLFPHDATCRAHLARLYHKMGLAREARRQVRIALKIDAKDRDAQRMAKGLGMLD